MPSFTILSLSVISLFITPMKLLTPFKSVLSYLFFKNLSILKSVGLLILSKVNSSNEYVLSSIFFNDTF